MASLDQPKVILFDIGGVCVRSPFQSILDYELSLGIPPGWVNYSISKTSPNGSWHKIERGEIPLDAAFYKGFNEDLRDPTRWTDFYKREQAKNPSLPEDVPPLPTIDGEWLFNEMMTASNHPDPWMFPALKKLKASGRYILAALSNTVAFPKGHKLHVAEFLDDPVRRQFDIFISSAHVGVRKPDPAMYRLAVQKVNQLARDRGATEDTPIQPRDILFLDDIGENLKGAKLEGFRTIKVPLGKAYEAVEELERITGLKLAGDEPKIPITPVVKAKI